MKNLILLTNERKKNISFSQMPWQKRPEFMIAKNEIVCVLSYTIRTYLKSHVVQQKINDEFIEQVRDREKNKHTNIRAK